jgi:hypothetical protein
MNLDPANNPNSGGRWYPTLTALPNGEAVVFGGHPDKRERYPSTAAPRHSNNIPERYSPWVDRWTPLAAPPFNNDQKTAIDGDSSAFDYHRTFLMPDGTVFFSSRVRDRNRFYDPYAGTFAGSPDFAMPPAAEDPIYSEIDGTWTAVLLPLLHGEDFRPRVLVMGGVRAYRIDLGATSPQWVQAGGRDWADPPLRYQGQSVILPTGEVFVCGGTTTPFDVESAVVRGETYDPGIDWATGAYLSGAGSWRTDPASEQASVRRHYHSTALLLPNGTVWTAGSDLPEPDFNELRIEIYSPSYVGQSGRPMIQQVIAEPPPAGASPALVGRLSYHSHFVVKTGAGQANDISRVALIRCGAVTHSFNTEQRYLTLDFEVEDGETLRVAAPPSGNVAPPGHYMLWVITQSNNLPCEEAKFVFLTHRRCALFTNKSELASTELDALKADSEADGFVRGAFNLHLEGFAPSEFGATTIDELNALAPVVTITLPSGVTGSIAVVPQPVKAEDPSRLDQPQLLIFTYDIDGADLTIPGDVTYFQAGDVEVVPPSGVDPGLYSCTGTFFFKGAADPYILDGEIPWLSTDLRTFRRLRDENLHRDDTVTESPRLTGDGPDAARAFLQGVVSWFNANPLDFESLLPADSETMELILSSEERPDDRPSESIPAITSPLLGCAIERQQEARGFQRARFESSSVATTGRRRISHMRTPRTGSLHTASWTGRAGQFRRSESNRIARSHRSRTLRSPGSIPIPLLEIRAWTSSRLIRRRHYSRPPVAKSISSLVLGSTSTSPRRLVFQGKSPAATT